MRFEAKIGDRGEIVIPPDLLHSLHLEPETSVTVDLTPTEDRLTGKPIDREAFHRLVEQLREPMIVQMRADGYNSVDEYIDDIRGR